jgi:hypothetical protein
MPGSQIIWISQGSAIFQGFHLLNQFSNKKNKIHNRITGITIKEWAVTVALLKKFEFFLVLNYCFDRFTLKIIFLKNNFLIYF